MLGAGACLALGLFAMWEGRRLGLFAFGAAEPGLFPFLFGTLLALAATLALARDTLATAAPAPPPRDGGGSVRQTLVYLGALGAYVLLLGPLGFVVTTALALFALMAVAERMAWRRAALIACLAAAAAWMLFVRLLAVPLPVGHWLPT
ncbi:MAG: tripartite tricarboxylate transporter TctB family protein [Alphaproteobacteria bacterium]|nr:tripartite tricarboxylate transporter TctB family protein [Alphaproteobacteria bacterium]